MNTIKLEKGNSLLVAHRDLSGIECENTNASFVAAGNRSYYGIECDIYKTAGGKSHPQPNKKAAVRGAFHKAGFTCRKTKGVRTICRTRFHTPCRRTVGR